MIHDAKNFDHLLGQLPGLSDSQLEQHFDLYLGYVKKINEIEDKLMGARRADANYSFGDVSELHRRRSVAYNGALLHELFFENLSAQIHRPSPELQKAIDSSFGSIDDWSADMRAALVSAPGWVLLCRSRRDGSLRNALIEEHHRGLLAEQDILLAIDGWEHAYMIDFGINKLHYIKTIEPLLDWEAASRRFIVFRSRGIQEPAAA